MKRDARSAGLYENAHRGIKCDKIRIVRIEDIIHHGARVDLALHPEATNHARLDFEGSQLTLNLQAPETELILKPKKEAASAVNGSRRKVSATARSVS